ncbi:ECF RNA polymerase sigma factor RpoE [Maioricimonas rarisocia]|uniref:ECF RNA polymerase sigma factor RpoE n=1 Tax=Maioricimonas rarisocia TaxID=2528026 RepID=A0A517Z0K0_9PLAN|nr:sigma-70 family RNA polymerase sigma factor [Maioricimonas rarisocia]QDU35983.1 ECF RNA polymerase sigma factor RpoE [Maioricimonas rarisocia]
MDSTSVSLLRRLREPDRDAAWERFVELYAPLIYHWGTRQGLSQTDAADLVQDVLATLVRKLPEFQYDPTKRFRGWLRTITVNRANDLLRRNAVRPHSGQPTDLLKVAAENDSDLFEESQYRAYLVGRMRQLIESEFEPQTWQACWKSVTEDRTAAEIGRELGISANAVRVAKCRVLRRLREELDGLLD